MEQRLIDANALKKAFCNHCDGDEPCTEPCVDIGLIETAPTVDAVPVVHSAWKHEIEDMGIYRHHTVRCLNCKCGFTHAYVVLLCGDTGDLFMHCPNCGATMDGKETGQ